MLRSLRFSAQVEQEIIIFPQGFLLKINLPSSMIAMTELKASQYFVQNACIFCLNQPFETDKETDKKYNLGEWEKGGAFYVSENNARFTRLWKNKLERENLLWHWWPSAEHRLHGLRDFDGILLYRYYRCISGHNWHDHAVVPSAWRSVWRHHGMDTWPNSIQAR